MKPKVSLNLTNKPLGSLDAYEQRENISELHLDSRSLLFPTDVAQVGINNSRIVFGSKGSGKTHLLLHIGDMARQNDVKEIYSTIDIGNMLHNRSNAYESNLFSEEKRLFWADLWKLALNVSALSIFLCKSSGSLELKAIRALSKKRKLPEIEYDYKNKNDLIRSRFLKYIKENYSPINWVTNEEFSPVEAISKFTAKYTNYAALENDLLAGLDVVELQNDVAILLKNYKPIHFLVDGIDEFAKTHPNLWADVQYGLYKAVYLLTKFPDQARYIRITISLRNYMIKVLRSDTHFDRINDRVTYLRWNRNGSEQFLSRSLIRAKNKFIDGGKNGNFARVTEINEKRPFASWLGFDEVEVTNRNSRESVEDYFLRHTKLLPRDIVYSFNSLAQIQNKLFLENKCIDELVLKHAISDIAEEVGDKMLSTCAEEIIIQVPSVYKLVSDTLHSASRADTVVEYLKKLLTDGIHQCKNEKVNRGEFLEILLKQFEGFIPDINNATAQEAFADDIEGILWRSGVFAYQTEFVGDLIWEFSWTKARVHRRYKNEQETIGFHSSLVEVAGIKASNDKPIF